jgi:8-oxo-dGTP pyrophosphatase MutT (NUDIX family)
VTPPPEVVHIDRLELAFAPKPWVFADDRRADIDAMFAQMRQENPALWNGRVLMLHHRVIAGGVLQGEFLETDYAGFAAWHRWGLPAAAIYDCFGAAAVMAADGAFLIGAMAAHTLNAGYLYFPCGTPDRSDIVDGRVDLEFSVRRELKEETGLDAAEFAAEPGWTIVIDGSLIAAIKILRSEQSAETLRARVLAHLAHEKQPELTDIRFVRSAADFDPKLRRWVTAFLARQFVLR